MPSNELAYRTQTAILWSRQGTDPFGQQSIGDPVEVSVRWDDTIREIVGPQGTNIAIDATAIIDRRVSNGDLMLLGTLSSIPEGTNLRQPTVFPPEWGQLMQVVKYDEVPDVKGRSPYREALLMRYKDTLSGG